MQKTTIVSKPLGWTSHQLIEQFRKDNPDLAKEKISYAGRLDPLAEGVMLLLIGEENKNREQYLYLDKEYIFEMILGVSTDSYDLLGVPQNIINPIPENFEDKLIKLLPKYTGKITQSFPPYSSKPVNGHALWYWAKQGKLKDIKLPTHEVRVYKIEIINRHLERSERSAVFKPTDFSPSTLLRVEMTKEELHGAIKEKINLINGDFRQEEILKAWEEFFKTTKLETFPKLTLKVNCSSGFYVRQLVEDLGKDLGCGAVTYSIRRTKIGNYHTTLT